MAVFAPLVLVPGVLVGGYYSWKFTFNESSKFIRSVATIEGDEQPHKFGALVGASSVFVFAGAVVLHNFRSTPKKTIDRSAPAPVYTTQQFLKGSKSLILKSFGLWCTSAVAGAVGSYMFAKISSPSNNTTNIDKIINSPSKRK